ncbi:hypothetical protein [Pelagicoccus mobilis]|uniref:Uncharacterized protein n=1 Tax=Pelagicoccus mobilis TaxID=415221 RepID=A0A934RXC0_9BACT|nr:hypothetical protein [Pelagicoccus mobilis]MBK1875604.1 hypothetical protein [Pelagicoccus mobilis]
MQSHEGCHWSYRPDGSYCYWLNEEDPDAIEAGVGFSSISPGDKRYVNPIEKTEEYYMKFCSTSEVVDPALIEMLEREDTPEEDATIDVPLTQEEEDDLRRRGVLPED